MLEYKLPESASHYLDMKDSDLIIRMQGDDMHAYQALALRHHKVAYDSAFAIVRDDRVAEEVTQDTLCKLYRHKTIILPEKRIQAWLHTVATNEAINCLRNKHNLRYATLLSDPEFEVQRGPVDWDRVFDLIESEEADLLRCAYLKRMSASEIAAELGTNANNIYVRLARAKDALKIKVRTHGCFDDFVLPTDSGD